MYIQTNESLPSIIMGLQPNKEDNILAICGSGDQAFALAVEGAQVLAVDNDPFQVDYAKRTQGILEQFDYNNPQIFKKELCKIFEGESMGFNENFIGSKIYFSNEKLEKLKPKIKNIEFILGDIFELKKYNPETFSKVYLSNSFNYGETLKKNRKNLPNLLNLIKKEGLLFVTNQPSIWSSYYEILFKNGAKILNKSLLKNNFILEENLTKVTRKIYNKGRNHFIRWKPSVYKKIA